MMLRRLAVLVVAAIAIGTALSAEIGKPGISPAPCPDQAWEPLDPSFMALPGARALFGHYEGGTYRIEVPERWNGELVLWAHGYVANSGPQGSRLRVGFPGVGAGSPLRAHLIESGVAWGASSYRCNGYVPGRGLLDTMALTDLFTKHNDGKPPARVYLAGASMGGHIALLGMQEFPTAFAGGLAMCPSGPGEMDFLTSVAAASELVTGLTVSASSREQDVAALKAALGDPPKYTEKGRQLASIQVQISGGPRPFAMEGLASRLTENASTATSSAEGTIWNRVASNAGVRYAIDDGLGLTAESINARVRRKAADADARSPGGPYEEAIPFDGRFERPVITLHGTGDLYVPISLEQTLKRAVDAAGRSSSLVQRIIRSPGHCTFSGPEQTAAFNVLAVWASQGQRPEGDDVLGDLSDAGRRFTNPLREGDPGTLRVPPVAR
jgi:pimeloyl-ACP methyl ester carboxylesterase